MNDKLKSMFEDVRVQLDRLEEHWNEETFPKQAAIDELLCRMEDLDAALLEEMVDGMAAEPVVPTVSIDATHDTITCVACRVAVQSGDTCPCPLKTKGPSVESTIRKELTR